MIETAAAIVTVVTELWFVWDKVRPIVVKLRPTPETLPVPTPANPQHGTALEAIASTLALDPSRYALCKPSPDEDPISAEQLGPWATTGDFFANGKPAYALYVRNPNEETYSLVVIGSPNGQGPKVYTIASEIQSARYMYVECARPGRYRIGESVRRGIGPKTVRIRHEGFICGTYESAARLIWWDPTARAFREQWLVD